MPSNYTENYQLSLWEAEDKVQRTDFNSDNAKIDAALKTEADARTAAVSTLAAQVAGKGNCSIGVFTYSGSEKYSPGQPTRITFPRMPSAYFVIGDSFLSGRGGSDKALVLFLGNSATAIQHVSVTWSGTTLSISTSSSYVSAQMCMPSVVYTVVAFYAES